MLLPRTIEKDHRTGHCKRRKPKGNIKLVNSVNKKSSRQEWSSDSQVLTENRDKKWRDNSNEMSWWKGFPSQLQDLVFVVFWSWPCKHKSSALQGEAIFSVSWLSLFSGLSNLKQINQMFLDLMSYLDNILSFFPPQWQSSQRLPKGFPRIVYNNCLHFQTSNSFFNPLHCALCLCYTWNNSH